MTTPLPLLAAACCAGVLVADAGWLGVDAALAGGGLCAALAAGWRGPRGRVLLALGVAFAVGAAALAARLDAATRGAAALAADYVDVEGRVAALTSAPEGWRAELVGVVGLARDRPPPPPRLRLRGEPTPDGLPRFEATPPGARVRARVRLRAVTGLHNPGGRDLARAAARAGIGAEARLLHPALFARVAGRGVPGWSARERALARLYAAGEAGALLAALALGEVGGLGPELRDVFARLGIAHLLSVSGLHLVLVAGLAFALVRAGPGRSAALAARRDTRRIAFGAALVAASAYALVAGFAVPVRRSLVMLLAAALAIARGRGRAAAPLSLAALLVLAFEPDALFAAGAQLSFLASAALARSARTARGAGALRTAAVAFAVTAPLAALRLGSQAPFAWLVNLVAVPWSGAVLLPAALAAALAAATGPGALPEACISLAVVAARASLAAARLLDGWLPGASGGAAPATPWLVAACAAACAALVARGLGACIAWSVLVGALLFAAPPAPLEPAPPRAVFLDVGQGDATLVQGRSGTLLVDGGWAGAQGADLGRTVVVPALRALGVVRLDLLVATHADLDHRGGLPAVLRALPVARVWLPYGGSSDPAFAELVAAARASGAALEEQGAGGAPLRAGDLLVEPLWPPPGPAAGSRNDRSLTLRVALAGRRLLLPGDLEAGAEERLLAAGSVLGADVLKLAHHGSRTSSTPAWLAAVDGVVAVASAPRAGRFGMPHPEVVARARAAGYSLWWTGREGAVLIGFEPRLHVRGWR